jgi:signal transduction histidine kinase
MPKRGRGATELRRRSTVESTATANKAATKATIVVQKGRIILSTEPLSGPRMRRPRPAETLFAVSRAVGSHLGLSDVLQQTTRALGRAVGAQIASVWRFDAREQERPVPGRHGPTQLPPAMLSSMMSAQVLTSSVRETGEPVYSSDSAHDPRFDHPVLRTLPHRSVLIQPLRVNGAVAGAFVFIWTRARHRFTPAELGLVDAATQQAGVAIEHAELLADVRRFNEELERRVKNRTSRLRRAYEELRSSREELRALSLHMERVRESERTRIAREIHDELGQALTGLKMNLERVFAENGHTVLGADAARMPLAIDDMVATVRRIASELRPPILDDLGLQAALEWQAQEFETRTGVKCRFRCQGTLDDVHVERSIALFRIFQEILTNVARHAEATRVYVTIAVGRASVRLDVRDNGKGLAELPFAHQRLGLLGMQERAAAFGGRVSVSGAPLKGTRVHVHIPMDRGAASGDTS